MNLSPPLFILLEVLLSPFFLFRPLWYKFQSFPNIFICTYFFKKKYIYSDPDFFNRNSEQPTCFKRILNPIFGYKRLVHQTFPKCFFSPTLFRTNSLASENLCFQRTSFAINWIGISKSIWGRHLVTISGNSNGCGNGKEGQRSRQKHPQNETFGCNNSRMVGLQFFCSFPFPREFIREIATLWFHGKKSEIKTEKPVEWDW